MKNNNKLDLKKVIFNGQLPHARHRVRNERDGNALTQDSYT